MNKKVAFYTLGCKLNYSETSSIGRQFNQAGFNTVEFTDTPDVFVINTCSVTDNADKKCKKVVKEALKISPNAYITIVGCYAQLKPKEPIRLHIQSEAETIYRLISPILARPTTWHWVLAVADVVARQRSAGLDVISDGEQTKTGFFAYIGERLSGFEPRPGRDPLAGFRAEIESFPEYYEQYLKRAMTGGMAAPAVPLGCTGPVSYTGHERLRRDLELLRAAAGDVGPDQVFACAVARRARRPGERGGQRRLRFLLAGHVHAGARSADRAGQVRGAG